MEESSRLGRSGIASTSYRLVCLIGPIRAVTFTTPKLIRIQIIADVSGKRSTPKMRPQASLDAVAQSRLPNS